MQWMHLSAISDASIILSLFSVSSLPVSKWTICVSSFTMCVFCWIACVSSFSICVLCSITSLSRFWTLTDSPSFFVVLNFPSRQWLHLSAISDASILLNLFSVSSLRVFKSNICVSSLFTSLSRFCTLTDSVLFFWWNSIILVTVESCIFFCFFPTIIEILRPRSRTNKKNWHATHKCTNSGENVVVFVSVRTN